MSTTVEKTTIYLNPYVKKFLKLKAANENSTLSKIINEEFADLLEDMEDAYELAQCKTDPKFTPWLEVKAQLKADGHL